MINSTDLAKLNEIQRLLDEAYANYFAKDSEGYCKSSEAAVTITFGTFFDRRDGNHGPVNVEIYSYIFGPNRLNNFRTIDAALAAVTSWHAKEMARDYDKDED